MAQNALQQVMNSVGKGILFLENCVSKSTIISRGSTLILGGATGGLVSACSLFKVSGQSIESKHGGQISMSGVAILNSVYSSEGGRTYLYRCNFGKYSGTNVGLGGSLYLDSCEIRGTAGSTLYAHNGGQIHAYTVAVKNVDPSVGYGAYANTGGKIYLYSVTIEYCLIAAYALNGGSISAYSVILTGNTTNYSPSSSGALGNNGGLISVI